MLRRLLLLVVVITLALTVASVWEISIAPFLAVGSAVGVAVGLGAQGVVRDVLAGFLILAEDQYKIGDVVRVAGVAGQVEDIRPRVTVLRDLDGNVHYVPNGEVKVASNLTQRYAQVVLDVAIAPEQPVDRALAVLADLLSGLAGEQEWAAKVIGAPEVLGVESIDPGAVVLRAVVKVAAEDRWAVRREALRRVKNRFAAEGIETALPPVYRRGE
jgi:small conductance mechanosensitive channel